MFPIHFNAHYWDTVSSPLLGHKARVLLVRSKRRLIAVNNANFTFGGEVDNNPQGLLRSPVSSCFLKTRFRIFFLQEGGFSLVSLLESEVRKSNLFFSLHKNKTVFNWSGVFSSLQWTAFFSNCISQDFGFICRPVQRQNLQQNPRNKLRMSYKNWHFSLYSLHNKSQIFLFHDWNKLYKSFVVVLLHYISALHKTLQLCQYSICTNVLVISSRVVIRNL